MKGTPLCTPRTRLHTHAPDPEPGVGTRGETNRACPALCGPCPHTYHPGDQHCPLWAQTPLDPALGLEGDPGTPLCPEACHLGALLGLPAPGLTPRKGSQRALGAFFTPRGLSTPHVLC